MISIIVPMYNTQEYILDCLISLENQIYTNFEVIIVDDGSYDQSRNIVESFICNTKMKISLVLQENRGVSAARNNGIKNSNGCLICFVDSDDIVHPNYLEELVNIMEKDESDIVLCNLMFFHDIENDLTRFNSFNIKQKGHKIGTNKALQKYLYREITPGIGSFLIRKEIIIENNLRFEEMHRYSEDIEFIFKALSKSKVISLINLKLYGYRIRETSAMSYVDEKRVDGYILMKGLEKYFDEGNSSFAIKFRQFGVARWVWATLWQIAFTSRNYEEFRLKSTIYSPKINMNLLLKFPKFKIRISALIYLVSPYIYFKLVKNIFRKGGRLMTS